MGSTTDMTTPTSMGNHGGTVTSCSPYAYPGIAGIRILLRTWSTVAPGTYELAFLIKKKKGQPLEAFLPWRNVGHVYPPFRGSPRKPELRTNSAIFWLPLLILPCFEAEGIPEVAGVT